MNRIAIAIPCLITGLLFGAVTLSEAAPLPPGGDQIQQQMRRVNIIGVQKFDATIENYGCFPGLNVTDCIADPIISLDDDTTFKLLSVGGSLHCGTVPMAQGDTCTYANAVYGLDCDLRCGSPTLAANQLSDGTN